MLIGTNFYEGDPPATRRQAAAIAALQRLPGVEALNVQFRTGPQAVFAGIETLPVLEQDSVSLLGAGRRKPMTKELIDVCADAAAMRGHRYFGYINSDIVVLPAAVEMVEREARTTYAICRQDVDADGTPIGPILMSGIDMFVWSVDWWKRHARRFRPYVVGDSCWDNVYTAIMMCHSDGMILNRDPLILHEHHPAIWNDNTPTARYNGFLAALDARYFSLWCTYFERLEPLRRRTTDAAAEQALRDEVFVWRASALAAAKQSVRSLRARARWSWQGPSGNANQTVPR